MTSQVSREGPCCGGLAAVSGVEMGYHREVERVEKQRDEIFSARVELLVLGERSVDT
jgi:hypothetical protein